MNDDKAFQYFTDLDSLLQNPDMYLGFISRDEKVDWVVKKTVKTKKQEMEIKKVIEKEKMDLSKDSVDSKDVSDSLEKEKEDEKEENEEEKKEKKEKKEKEEVDYRMVPEKVEKSQGAVKIFKEILQNAIDREHWTRGKEDPLTYIKVTVNPLKNGGTITIKNDGAGIPVTEAEIDGKRQYHVTALFSRFKSSSNYKSTEKDRKAGREETKVRFTGGKNGFGAKATNAFSKSFTVRTFDATRDLLFEQTWLDNLSVAKPPKITTKKSQKTKRGYTEIEFVPDWVRLGFPEGINEGTQRVLEACTWSACACTGPKVKVYYNDQLLPIKSFSQYASLFVQNEDHEQQQQNTVIAYDYIAQPISSVNHKNEKEGKETTTKKVKDAEKLDRTENMVRFEVCVMPMQEIQKAQQKGCIGFVNALQCSEGEHMDFVYEKIRAHIKEKVSKRAPELASRVTPKMVKSRFFVALRTLLDDPLFDAQTKERLDSPKASKFGFEWSPGPAFWKKIDDMGVIEALVEKVEQAETKNAVKNAGTTLSALGGDRHQIKKPIIDKYEPAKNAGVKGNKAILMIVEGDSAKTFVMSGISVVGRENFGIFPIKGKPLNVRGKSVASALKNKEIGNILKIMGVRPDMKQTWDDLNYGGGICGVTDQDSDGGHIMGLLMNLMHCLVKFGLDQNPRMMLRFATPQFRFTAKTKAAAALMSSSALVSAKTHADTGATFVEFTSAAAVQQWMASAGLTEESANGMYEVEYFKGLGTSTAQDAKRYFQNIQDHMVYLHYTGHESDECCKDMFDKKRAEQRRHKLLHVFDPRAFVDYSSSFNITWPEYFNKEVLDFSFSDLQRSVPHFGDGLKPSQRAILFTMIDKNITKKAKVVEVTGKVMEHTHYGHGEASLHTAIPHMAQDFWGTNNINFMVPQGQFGSRVMGRTKGVASARYIYTNLNTTIVSATFPKKDFDMGIVGPNIVDGEKREPEFLLPVLPLVLVNGSHGVGTGWKCDMQGHNPKEVSFCMRSLLLFHKNGQPQNMPDSYFDLKPWYAHNRGTLELVTSSSSSSSSFSKEEENENNKKSVSVLSKGIFHVTTDPLFSPFSPSLASENSKSDLVYIHITELPIGTWTDVYTRKIQDFYLLGGKRSEEMKKKQLLAEAAAEASRQKLLKEGTTETGKPQKPKGKPQKKGKTIKMEVDTSEIKNEDEDEKDEKEEKEEKEEKDVPGEAPEAGAGEGEDGDGADHMNEKYVKADPFIREIDTYNNTDTVVHIILKCDRALYEKHVKGNEARVLFLEKLLQRHMNMWGPHTAEKRPQLVEYRSIKHIFTDFYAWRLSFYEKRKELLIADSAKTIKILNNKARFVKMVALDKTLVINNRKKHDLLAEMDALQFDKASDLGLDFTLTESNETEDNSLAQNNSTTTTTRYNYLIKIPVDSFTEEMVQKILAELEKMQAELALIKETSPLDMWLADLDEFDAKYEQFLAEREAKTLSSSLSSLGSKNTGAKSRAGKGPQKTTKEQKQISGAKRIAEVELVSPDLKKKK